MKSFLLIIIVLAYLPCHSQLKGFSIGPYVELGWPTSDFAKKNGNGLGVGLGTDIGLGKLKLTGSIGFIHFGDRTMRSESNSTHLPAINALPIRAGLKFRIFPLLYVKVEGGVAKYTDSNNTAFIFSPCLGLLFFGLDVQTKYEAWMKEGTNCFWGLKIGYNF